MKIYVRCTFLFFCLLQNLYSLGQNNQLKSVIEAFGVYSNGDFVPYYMGSNRYGIVSPKESAVYARGNISYAYNSRYFGLEAGLDIVGSTLSSNYYKNNSHIQQLYVSTKMKKFAVSFGMREEPSMLVNQTLSSGNMVWSNNSRPIPQIKIGTTDYVSVPLTNDWLNFYADFSYGITIDGDYNEEIASSIDTQSEKRTVHVAKDVYIHRKNIFIRTKKSAFFVLTLGFEHVAQFGGTVDNIKNRVKGKDFVKVFLGQKDNGLQNYNHLASIDIKFDVNLNAGSISGYTQLFMDEISKRGSFRNNGMDGLWGLEWKSKEKGFLSGLVLEYLTTTNQGGPVYANEEVSVYNGQTYYYSGCSNYYNDQYYGAWSNYGMAYGTPLIKSPIYNNNNYTGFSNSLVRAVHFGLEGVMSSKWNYKLFLSSIKSWGTPLALAPKPLTDFSCMLECCYKVNDWEFMPSLAFDSGTLYGDSFGFTFHVRKVIEILK